VRAFWNPLLRPVFALPSKKYRYASAQFIPLHEIAWQNPRLAKRYDRRRCQLDGAQILSGRLASPAVCDDVERDLLPLNEAAHAGAFDRTDMNEDVFATALQLNEAEAFLAVKPLYSSLFMGVLPLGTRVIKPRRNAAG
jgi:hypothetical protein